MFHKTKTRIAAAAVSAVVISSALMSPVSISSVKELPTLFPSAKITANAAGNITINDLPSDYKYAADWIWNNRITKEDSTGSQKGRYNGLFDQIIAGKGTLNYVVRWQSYKTVTLQQRKQFETMLSNSINDWNKWLAGYENWPYEHIEVKIVGWAVIDKNCLLDLQPDEIVYTDTTYYDSQYDTSNGYETIPDKLPNAPDEISRFEHFADKSYQYPGGLDKRFDMYMWATEGFPSIGGCGGDWGQRLSDTAYLNMLDGSGIHVFEHELGHGFGMTDFYGGEGASDGFPPGGFPGGENSLMMAGSASKITDFDGWMLRYMWTKIKDENGRFDIEAAKPPVTTIGNKNFEDEITECGDGYVVFANNGRFTYGNDSYGSDEAKNLAHYEIGDKISISFRFNETTSEIISVESLTLIKNATVISAFETIEAENFSDQSGIRTEECSEGGQNVGYIENGDYIFFKNLDFEDGAISFTARTSGAGNDAKIEIYIDNMDSTPVGVCYPPNGSSWQNWTDSVCNIAKTEGVHDVYLKFTGGDGYLMNINNFVFSKGKAMAKTIVGDLDFSGNIDVFDFVFLKHQILYKTDSDARKFAASDIDGDGSIGVADAVLLQKYLLAAIDNFPAGVYANYEI